MELIDELGKKVEILLSQIDLTKCEQLPTLGYKGSTVPVKETSKIHGGMSGVDIVTKIVYYDGQEFRIKATLHQVLTYVNRFFDIKEIPQIIKEEVISEVGEEPHIEEYCYSIYLKIRDTPPKNLYIPLSRIFLDFINENKGKFNNHNFILSYAQFITIAIKVRARKEGMGFDSFLRMMRS